MPRRKHYTVYLWFERDNANITVDDEKGKTIAEWHDDEAYQMGEDGFFVFGRGEKALAESVLSYLEYIGVIKSKNYTYEVR